jgi:hypothetical protein
VQLVDAGLYDDTHVLALAFDSELAFGLAKAGRLPVEEARAALLAYRDAVQTFLADKVRLVCVEWCFATLICSAL